MLVTVVTEDTEDLFDVAMVSESGPQVNGRLLIVLDDGDEQRGGALVLADDEMFALRLNGLDNILDFVRLYANRFEPAGRPEEHDEAGAASVRLAREVASLLAHQPSGDMQP